MLFLLGIGLTALLGYSILESIANYFRDRYPTAAYAKINNMIKRNIKSNNCVEVSCGIYDNNNNKITTESVISEMDSSIKKGMIIEL